MKILLIGEYSNLHNSLKQGLQKNGFEVTLLSTGDGFKNFDSDIPIKSSLFENKFLKLIAKLIDRLIGVSLNEIEIFIKAIFKINKLKGFDIVQLINERAFGTSPKLEKTLLKLRIVLMFIKHYCCAKILKFQVKDRLSCPVH